MKFKVGDEVKQLQLPNWGVGIIISIELFGDRPVRVQWFNTNVSSYTVDGYQNDLCIRKLTKLEKALK